MFNLIKYSPFDMLLMFSQMFNLRKYLMKNLKYFYIISSNAQPVHLAVILYTHSQFTPFRNL